MTAKGTDSPGLSTCTLKISQPIWTVGRSTERALSTEALSVSMTS